MHVGRAGDRLRAPDDLDGLDRLRYALEFQRPDIDERFRGVATRQQFHDLSGQDLAALGEVAEPCCFDHRIAEVVAVLFGGLSGGDADPDGQLGVGLAPIVALDRLLHSGCAAERVAETGERNHEAVTEVLHLGPAGALDRASQEREVHVAKFLSRTGSETRGEFGRAHEIREQDRHRLHASTDVPSPVAPLAPTRACACGRS